MNYFNPQIDKKHIAQMSSLALAHIGDSVFELMARCFVISKSCAKSSALHKASVSIVCAQAQARAAELIIPMLTTEEHAVFIRGRNAKPKTIPKNTTHKTYSLATALEVLFGWLYLNGNIDRLNSLFAVITDSLSYAISD